MTEERFRQLLEDTAVGIARDIAGDHQHVDTSWEAYVRELPGVGLCGYIYMGDAGEWAYRVGADGDSLDDDYAILKQIKRTTVYSDEIGRGQNWDDLIGV